MTVDQNMPSIAAVDLFCGVGGMTHGMQLAGIDVRAGFDNDPNCRYAFSENNNAEFIESDIWNIEAPELTRWFTDSDYTLIAGGPPCQPFSTYAQSARKRRPNEDWQLVRKFGEIASAVAPDFIVMENVPSLLKHSVFEELVSLLGGYHVTWSVVNVVDIGVAQTRRRLILVASKFGPVELAEIGLVGKVRTVRDVIGGLPAISAGASNSEDPLHIASRLSSMNQKRIRASVQGGTWRDWPDELLSDCHKRKSGASYPSVYGRMSWDSPSPTITTQCFGYGNGRFGHPDQDRAISLREAAMLQSFPLEYSFVEPGDKVKFSQLGRLIGNAVPVRLAEVIGELVFCSTQGMKM